MKRFFNLFSSKFDLSDSKKQHRSILLDFSKETLQKWGFIFIVIISVFFVSNGIIKGNIRLLTIVSLLFILGVCCLKIESGVIGILIFLPFMGILRRYIYYFNPYVTLDPILIISSILTLFMFGYIFVFYGEEILNYSNESKLFKYVIYLLILFVLEAFNPFQGGLAVGFSGIMYIVVPFLWFYFGFFFPTNKMATLFYIISIIGIITSIYGLHQIYYGLLPFEKYWMEYGGFGSIKIKGFLKAFSTFMSPQEFANYLLIASAISFMYLFKKIALYPIWIIGFIVLMYGVFMTSTRSAIFYFFALVSFFISLKLKSFSKAIIANIIIVLILVVGLPKIKLSSGTVKTAKEANMEHLASGVKDPFDEESTFWRRVDMARWTFNEMFSTPFGRGIGAITLGSGKFGGQVVGGMELFQLAIIGACGIPGLILGLIIIYWLIKNSIFLIKKDSDTYLIPCVLTVWLIITGEPRLYSIGPFFYLLLGWVTKESIWVQRIEKEKKRQKESF
ncbi:MAG: hypothetical protein WC614_09865 [bacterium]